MICLIRELGDFLKGVQWIHDSSDISDHDASIIFIECPKFQTRSFQREVCFYMNELTMKICQAKSIPSIGKNYLLTLRMLMKCVIPSPRHFSESQGSAFQPKWSLYVIAIDHGLIVNSEEKLKNETVFVRQQNIWQAIRYRQIQETEKQS